MAANWSVVLVLYLHMCGFPCALGSVEHLFISVAGSRSIMCGAFSGFCSLPPPSLLSTVYQCDGCLSSRGRVGSWLGCQVFPAIGAVSILELAANRKLQDVSGTQPPQSDEVVYGSYSHF